MSWFSGVNLVTCPRGNTQAEALRVDLSRGFSWNPGEANPCHCRQAATAHCHEQASGFVLCDATWHCCVDLTVPGTDQGLSQTKLCVC